MNSARPRKRSGVLRVTLIGGLVTFAAVGIGYWIGTKFAAAMLASVLKYLLGVVAIVWAFSLAVYHKLSDVTDIPGLDYLQHRNLENEIRSRLHWYYFRLLFLGLLALVIAFPSILVEAKVPVPIWLFGLAFGAVGLLGLSLARLWNELEEIRGLKSYVKELERREQLRDAQVSELKDGRKAGWEPDPKLDGFRESPPRRGRAK